MKWISCSNQDMTIIFKELLFYLIAIQPLGEPGEQNSCLSQVQCYVHLRHALYLKNHAWFSLCIRYELLLYILYWNMEREGGGWVHCKPEHLCLNLRLLHSVLPHSPYPLHPCLPLPPPPMSLALNMVRTNLPWKQIQCCSPWENLYWLVCNFSCKQNCGTTQEQT